MKETASDPSASAYPYPLAGMTASWACGYFTEEISKGFQNIYE